MSYKILNTIYLPPSAKEIRSRNTQAACKTGESLYNARMKAKAVLDSNADDVIKHEARKFLRQTEKLKGK